MKSQKSQITENHEKEADMPINFDSLLNDLAKGNIVTVPTETVEGYAVALSSEPGIKKLMKIKDRDYNSGKIFTLVPESKKAISKYAIITSIAQNLIKHFPGELTLILPKNPDFKHFYYNHYETIGIRIPNHPLFQKSLKQSAPSFSLLLIQGVAPQNLLPATNHQPS